ncbi:hypothetical protein Tco_0285049 [Tanacetum coccineum]
MTESRGQICCLDPMWPGNKRKANMKLPCHSATSVASSCRALAHICGSTIRIGHFDQKLQGFQSHYPHLERPNCKSIGSDLFGVMVHKTLPEGLPQVKNKTRNKAKSFLMQEAEHILLEEGDVNPVTKTVTGIRLPSQAIHHAICLFDSAADRSFYQIPLGALLDITPYDLDVSLQLSN